MDLTTGTILPLVTLGVLGWFVPWMIAPRFPDDLRGLGRALVLSAGVLLLLGTVLFVLLYRDMGMDLARILDAPGQALWHFLGLGAKSALVWGPVLALTGLALGQGVETRRGRRMAARPKTPDAGD